MNIDNDIIIVYQERCFISLSSGKTENFNLLPKSLALLLERSIEGGPKKTFRSVRASHKSLMRERNVETGQFLSACKT